VIDLLKIKRLALVTREEQEEKIVLESLSKQLKPLMEAMIHNTTVIGDLDFVIEKAKLAIRYGQTKPTFAIGQLVLHELFNPYVESQLKSTQIYTRNSIELKSGTTVLTGANMGGKTTVLKSIAQNVMLAHLGFYVSAKNAVIPMIEDIYFLGLPRGIRTDGLSAFGEELYSVNEMIEAIKTKNCLVLVDEFARSTNPYEGSRFVKALALYTNTHSSLTLLATHYDGIATPTMEHYQMKGLKDGNETKLLMDYNLIKVKNDQPVPKEAYKVAKLQGLNEDFMKELHKCYKEEPHE